jgi:xanthine dehydrogenase small subunit
MTTRPSIRFILNADIVETNVAPGMLALDFLRNQQRLSGTKEGCREGDCGACTVLVGELNEGGLMKYQPMTSCLIPMGELNGKHLVTIEGLDNEKLSTVQATMVDCGGTQCGYCTPGFVMSMTGWILDTAKPLNSKGLNNAISGNLCRCTGYKSIRTAGQQITDKLIGLDDHCDRIATLCGGSELPAYFLGIKKRLEDLSESDNLPYSPAENAIPIAGGTDLYVQQGEQIPEQPINLIHLSSPVEAAKVINDSIQVDARMSFEAFGDDPIIQEAIPGILGYNKLIASWPVRTRATLGGNLCNASSIGDITCLLLALGAEIDLIGNKKHHSLPLKEFFLGYHKTNKNQEEIIATIRFPKPSENTFINWEKVSKRLSLDIATVNSALSIEVKDNRIVTANLAIGGVAETPLFLSKTSAFLVGKEISIGLVFEANSLAQNEFSPISDIRGSAEYKRLLARQLILAHFVKGFPDQIREEVVYETLR